MVINSRVWRGFMGSNFTHILVGRTHVLMSNLGIFNGLVCLFRAPEGTVLIHGLYYKTYDISITIRSFMVGVGGFLLFSHGLSFKVIFSAQGHSVKNLKI